MPKPIKSESKKDYMGRCMGQEEMNSKFPDNSQRAAVCYAYWDKDKGIAPMKESTNTTEDQIKELAEEAGFTVSNIKTTTINNMYKEYVVDVENDIKDMNDRQFSQIAQSKKFRNKVKDLFGEGNLRSKSVVGMVVKGKGRFVMQLKNELKESITFKEFMLNEGLIDSWVADKSINANEEKWFRQIAKLLPDGEEQLESAFKHGYNFDTAYNEDKMSANEVAEEIMDF